MPSPSKPAQASLLGIGIDTGGTFTDIVLFDLAQQRILRKAKTPTTHGNYAVCVGNAFDALALAAQEVAALKRVCLSTTLATNTVAEHKVHPTALLVEPGDIAVPTDLHPRLVLLNSYMSFDAETVRPVSEREVLEKAAPLAAQVEGFAVSGYAATRNPAHERQIAELLKREFGKPVVLGSELTRQLNFMQRALAAALNAGLLAVILEWLRAVKSILKHHGIACPLYIVKGDGSLMEEAEALEQPVQTLFSGPAASLSGGTFLSGESDAVVVDVGGTTTDLGRVSAGRGLLRRGGIRINNRQIAVDGLDMLTFGLGGDSRFRLGPKGSYQFEPQRVLPFCRAADRYPEFSVAALETELSGSWHFGDPDLLELAALDTDRAPAKAAPGEDPGAAAILQALKAGPRRVRTLGLELQLPRFAMILADLVRQRRLVRIALTPTDLFCAEGHAPAFSMEAARHAMALYARMLDTPTGAFETALRETLRRQAVMVLGTFLLDHPELTATGEAMAHLTDLMLPGKNGDSGTRLALDPGCKVVLVGAGAPVLFQGLPSAMERRLTAPLDGDVANAVGAITSEFLLRETVSIEPVKNGGVELFDHEGKTPFPTLEVAQERARSLVRSRLETRARTLGLAHTRIRLHEEVLEEYAEFSRRTRKELVIARVEGILNGMPG
ncbi:MAG: hydantoinase/oxoprolinase family protein [Deltaproteobacteria bacterium]|nr:hydantoinase/oxoprolinase family protein [Deltaproteobacteria bacterium]